MADNGNLKKGNPETQFTSGREAVEAGRKGGIKSGIARRKKFASRKRLKEMLAYTTKPKPGLQKLMDELGGDPDCPLTVEDIMVLALIKKAMAGDLRAYDMVHEYLGEDPHTVLEEKRMKIQEKAVDAIRNSDGFIAAIGGTVEEVFDDGGDTPDALEDSE